MSDEIPEDVMAKAQRVWEALRLEVNPDRQFDIVVKALLAEPAPSTGFVRFTIGAPESEASVLVRASSIEIVRDGGTYGTHITTVGGSVTVLETMQEVAQAIRSSHD